MENKYSPLGYEEMLERIKYKKMLEEMSSTNDPEYTQQDQTVSPLERGPTQKFGDLLGRGLYNQPFGFNDERSAMASGQDLATVASYTPGPGNVLGYLEGEKMIEEGNPLLGSLISAASIGLPKNLNPFSAVKPNVVPPKPATKPLQHKILHTADRPRELNDKVGTNAWNSGTYSEGNLMPLRYEENNTEMMSQIALAESDLFKKPNKVYPINNILQGMRRYGVTGKGNVNQNVDRQIDDFLSEDFIAKGSATPAEVMTELQKNAPKIQETHAYYGLNSTMEGPAPGYLQYTTKRPVYDLDSPTTTYSNSTETMSQTYGERKFSMFDDGQLYGTAPTPGDPYPKLRRYENPKVNTFRFSNDNHTDLALGNKLSVGDTQKANNYMHQRYTFETIDGQENALVLQEFQSDPYKLTKDQGRLAARLARGDGEGQENVMSSMATHYEAQNGLGNTQELLEGVLRDENSMSEVISKNNPLFNEYLIGTNRHTQFYDDYTNLYKNYRSDLIAAERRVNELDPLDPMIEVRAQQAEEVTNIFDQQSETLIENAMSDFPQYLRADSSLAPRQLPRSADWFTDNVKLGLQTGANNNSPFVLIPNGARSLAPPAGETRVVAPKLVKYLEDKFADSPNVKFNYDTKGNFLNLQENKDGVFQTELFGQPSEKAFNRAKSYNEFLKKAMKQTEQDYGVKLNATEYIDGYDQEFLKIELTPELKEAFKVFRMNHGGEATLMPLKYDL